MTDRYGGLIDALWEPSPLAAAPLPLDPGFRFRLVARGAEGEPPAGATSGLSGAAGGVLQALGHDALTARELADACGAEGDGLSAILDGLYGQAVIEIVGETPVPAGPFYRHMAAYSRRVSSALDVPGLRGSIARNATDAVLRLGAYVEEYHYIRAAPTYVSLAVSSAATERQARILSEYLADEFWHDRWVRQGLLAGGIEPDDLDRAQPLPSTVALMNFLRWTAASDLPALCVCLGATEGTPASLPDIAQEFDTLRSSGVLPGPAFAPFEMHARIDAEHSHGSVFAEVFADVESVLPTSRYRIRNTVWQYWYAYRGFFQGILGYYSGRPRLDLLCFGEQSPA